MHLFFSMNFLYIRGLIHSDLRMSFRFSIKSPPTMVAPRSNIHVNTCVWIINTNNSIKDPIHECQNFVDTNQILIFGGYLKTRESFYTWVIIWVKAILSHIDARVVLPRYKLGSCMVSKTEYLLLVSKKCEILIIEIRWNWFFKRTSILHW